MSKDFWNTRLPQFLQRMEQLCIQADYLINRDDYCRGSRSCMGMSIYGFGFPQSMYYGNYGGYNNASASIYGSPYSGSYAGKSAIPEVPSPQERYQEYHNILNTIYENNQSSTSSSN